VATGPGDRLAGKDAKANAASRARETGGEMKAVIGFEGGSANVSPGGATPE
jgi:hypothetical protein